MDQTPHGRDGYRGWPDEGLASPRARAWGGAAEGVTEDSTHQIHCGYPFGSEVREALHRPQAFVVGWTALSIFALTFKTA